MEKLKHSFKVGDRVRITDVADVEGLVNSIGRIVRIEPSQFYEYYYRVEFDDMGSRIFYGHEMELDEDYILKQIWQ